MKTKFTIFSLIALLALVLSACGPVAGAQTQPRTISVNGIGQVSLKPDVAYIYVGVHTENVSAADAVSENTSKTTRLVEALKTAGVAADDIRTTNFSIYPAQQYSPDGQPMETKYMVDNNVYVTVRDLTKLGDLLDSAVKAGANSVNSITFDVLDKTQALADARKAAVEAAKKQAEELASAAGVSLVNIQNIQYYDSMPVPVVEGKGMGGAAMAGDVAVPISPGQLQLTATVTLTYEIK